MSAIELVVKKGIDVELIETLRSSEFDRGFSEEITKLPGCDKLYLCYQCGSCSAGCPVGKLVESFNPRQIIRMILLGLRDRVLSSDAIWICASCYTCQERCPQGVDIADLMLAIRNIAANEGYVPKAVLDQASSLIESGRIAQITELVKRRRVRIGLPEIPSTSLEAVKKIVEMTAFKKLIEKLERV